MENYGSKANSSANVTSDLLDLEKIIFYKNSLKIDEKYREIIKGLDKIKVNLTVDNLYVLFPIDKDNAIFIYDATEPGDGIENSELERCLLGKTIEIDDLAKKIIAGGKYVSSLEISNTKEYGYLASAYAPIKNSQNQTVAVVGVDISMNEIISRLTKYLIISILASIIIVSLGFLILFFVVKRNVISPIKKISEISKNFANDDKINVQLIDNISKDEIGTLSKSLNSMMINTKNYLENIKKVTNEKEQISAELNVATKIQKSMIPHIFPAFPELKEIDLYAVMKPAKQVGGDFYDFFLIDKNHLAFVIADVSGKGISAALFMVIAKTLIKNEANLSKDPGTIFERVNNQMCVNNELSMFTTASLGILDLQNGNLDFVNAGHLNPIIKFGSKKFKHFKVKKHFVLAGMPNLRYNAERVKLNPGDIIYIYTDGVTEAINSKNQFWGTKNLIKILNNIDVESAKLKEVTEIIFDKIKFFTNSSVQNDDITMLILKYIGDKN
ncbi:MAG: SpoIIE family protein phosphatase [Firmicutes bacterium]|nr:SpoIIE family protein phosphatase [Bacillota bacterium]